MCFQLHPLWQAYTLLPPQQSDSSTLLRVVTLFTHLLKTKNQIFVAMFITRVPTRAINVPLRCYPIPNKPLTTRRTAHRTRRDMGLETRDKRQSDYSYFSQRSPVHIVIAWPNIVVQANDKLMILALSICNTPTHGIRNIV